LAELQLFFNTEEFYNNTEKPTAGRFPPTKLYCDNNGAVALSRNPDQSKRLRHIDIAYHLVREKVEMQEIDMIYTSTDEMVADILTKASTTVKHDKHLAGMGISASQQSASR
jgi:hypothetical protein